MMEVLRINEVSKSFGDTRVLKGLSVSVEEGSVFGFIGKNGAGKTTTMKLILGFLQASGGEIYVCGQKVVPGNAKTNRCIGYLPDVPSFYEYMTPKEYLTLCGRITGMEPRRIREKSQELLDLVGLAGVNRRIRGFSRGMKQRLGIAQALLNEPKLLICDEPTSALDPVGRKEILDILSQVKNRTTIVFSTHILSDVERICDSIGILDEGKLVLQGSLSSIRDQYRKDSILLELEEECALQVKEKIMCIPSVLAADAAGNTITIHLTNKKEAGLEIIRLLAEEKVPVLKYEVLEPTLENVFLEVTK